MPYSKIVVNRIKQLCQEKGITANRLAKISGIAQSTLNDIIRGVTKDLRITVLYQIASAFDMTVAELLDIKELNEYSCEEN